MRYRSTKLGAVALSASMAFTMLGPQSAKALTFVATYYEVPDGSGDPDFGLFSTPTGIGNLVGGLPTATGGVNDLSGLNQIEWWSPSLDNHVTQTGTGTINTPYSHNMFPPNSTGNNDSSDYETATFLATFSSSGGSTISGKIASDDDTLVYLNGNYIGGQPGVKAIGGLSPFSGTTIAGVNTLEIFYADRENVAAAMDVTVSGVPETSTWVMMLLGFMGLGFAGYRKANRSEASGAL